MNKNLLRVLAGMAMTVMATAAVIAATGFSQSQPFPVTGSGMANQHASTFKLQPVLIVSDPTGKGGGLILQNKAASGSATNRYWIAPVNPAADTIISIQDPGANCNMMTDAGNFTIAGTFTFPTTGIVLKGTSFNATLKALGALGQATTYTLPDPGAAATNIMDTGSAQSITGVKTYADGADVNTIGTGATFSGTVGKLFGMSAVSNSSTGGAVDTTYTLPANSLIVNGKSLRLLIRGTTAANANNKTINLKFGSTTIALLSAVASNAKDFYADVSIYRTGSNTQQIVVDGYANAAFMNALSVTSAQTETATIAITLDLPTSTGAADVVLQNMTILAEP